MRRRFSQVDVFGTGPMTGNPVAVIHDSDGLSTDDMLAITAWIDLSETTFLLPPTDPAADYHVRIFCPGRELPFAGHPTLGTARAWLAAGGQPKTDGVVVQECGAGLVPVRRDEDRLAFAAPPLIRSGPVGADELARRLDVLGLNEDDVVDAVWIDNGPNWLGIVLKSTEAVLSVSLPAGIHEDFDTGLIGFAADADDAAIEVRALFPDANGIIREDPVTGSLNASVAQWLLGNGTLTAPYRARQGTAMGRRGDVWIDQADGEIWVGGTASVVVEGELDF